MTNFGDQLVTLERERKHLESLLESNTNWTSLRALDQKNSQSQTGEAESQLQREILINALSDNRVFQAHTRVVEVIELLSGLEEADHHTNRPATRDEATISNVKMPSSELPDKIPASMAASQHLTQGDVTPWPSGETTSGEAAVGPRARLSSSIDNDRPHETVKDSKAFDDHKSGSATSGDPGLGSSSAPITVYPTAFGSGVAATTAPIKRSAKAVVEDRAGPTPDKRLDAVIGKDIQPVLTIRTRPPEARHTLRQPEERMRSSLPTDDLTQIRTIHPKRAAELIALGVRQFEDIANWTAADVRTIRAALGLGTTINQQNWIEQAAVLAAKKADVLKEQDRVVNDGPLQEPNDKLEAAPSQAVAPDIPVVTDVQGDVETAGDVELAETNKSNRDPSPATEEVARPVAEGLMAVSGMTPKYIEHLGRVGIRSLSQLAELSGEVFQGLESYIDLRQQMLQASWVEQAAILATGQTTRHLRRLRIGDLSCVVVGPKLPLKSNAVFAARLAELIGQPVTSPSVNVAPSKDRLKDSEVPGSVPNLRIVETASDHDGETIGGQNSRTFSPNDEPVTIFTTEAGSDHSSSASPTAEPQPGPTGSGFTPASISNASPKQHSKNVSLLADAMRQMAESPITGSTAPATIQTRAAPSAGLMPDSLAEIAANDVGGELNPFRQEGDLSDQSAEPNSDEQKSHNELAGPESRLREDRQQGPDFREYVADSLTHVGPIEADVAIVPRGPDEFAPTGHETGEEIPGSPRFAPVFLQPEFVAGAVDDLPGSSLPGEVEHAIYQGDVQEARVNIVRDGDNIVWDGDIALDDDIVRDGDNSPHAFQQDPLPGRFIVNDQVGSVIPKAKSVLSRIVRALTGDR
ncbi:MAG: hypothetical protein ACRBCJ_12950 [Hyphomicrobiaceae bacterium]